MADLKVGDRVKVLAPVWDDRRCRTWQGWEGIVQAYGPEGGDYPVYVFFPKSRGEWRTFDFAPEELEIL
ncbi:MAG TPA: hypothetical protein VIY48_04580 [Candidatus Paceibacterota bacterium]